MAGIVLHMLADNVVETGFMVQHKLAYYTIQTNVWVSILFAYLVIRTFKQKSKNKEWRIVQIHPCIHGAITFYITMTMLGFWTLLAPTTGVPSNRFLLMNTILLHLITPLLAIGDYFFFCKHGNLKKIDACKWMAYPLGYLFFVIVYSQCIKEPYYSFQLKNRTIDLMYPYPFLDPNVLGFFNVAIAIVILCIVFYLIARIFIYIDSKIGREKKR